MLRIISHIERLLLVHDCVIVPKFGGFVLQTIPTRLTKEQTFCPSQKEIRFNATLQHNDGLLSESYMQQYHVNYRQAQLMVEEDVIDIKNRLQQEGRLSLGELGTFSIGEEGQTIFQPIETHLFSISSYGLPTFNFPILTPLQVEQPQVVLTNSQKSKGDVLYIPISRKLIRSAIASVAAVTLFLLISTPVKDVNQDTYTASFVPTEMVASQALIANQVEKKQTVPVVTPAQEPTEDLITREVKKEHSTSKKKAVASPKETKVQPTPEKKEVKKEVKTAPKMYHIVIASFPTETQADEFIKGVNHTECKHVSKVIRDGKYRIYADKFDNRKDAESYLATLRTNPKYKDAWLFISR